MIISGKPIQNVRKAYGDQSQVMQNAKTGKNQITQGKDEFILSSSGQDFGQVFNKIRGMSEVRPEKVKEFSDKINAGSYVVDSKHVADKMIGRTLTDDLR